MLNKDLLENVSSFKELYATAKPFPHVVIDGFFNPEILDVVLDEMIAYDAWSHDDTNLAHQVNKYYSPASDGTAQETLELLYQKAPVAGSVLNYLYSKEVFDFLTELTGISDLQGDTAWLGAGMHKVVNGGKLALHADFNKNWTTGLYRRINLLLYLNKDWKDEYGGHLELWERDLSKMAGKVAPIFNRAVIFSTMRDSYHGHPTPMTCPPDVARYSLALYYYNNVPHENEDVDFRQVDWK